MSAPPPNVDNQTLINWLLGIVTAVVGSVAAKTWTIIETLRKVSSDAAACYVPRVEMQKHLDDLRVEVQRDIDKWMEVHIRMHSENLGRFTRVDDALLRLADEIHERKAHR